MGHSGTQSDIELRLVAHNMVEAIIRGDLELARSVFHTDATITGQQDGILVRCGVPEYLDFCRRMSIPRRKVNRRYEIVQLDQNGPVAFIKTVERYPVGELISYMTLSRLNGRWQINNRTIYASGSTEFEDAAGQGDSVPATRH